MQASEDSQAYTFDMRKLKSALMVRALGYPTLLACMLACVLNSCVCVLCLALLLSCRCTRTMCLLCTSCSCIVCCLPTHHSALTQAVMPRLYPPSMDIAYSPTGKEFVTGGYDRTVRIFPVDKPTSREVYHTKRMQRIFCVSFSADARFVLSGSDDTNVRIWKSVANQRLGRVRAAVHSQTLLLSVFVHALLSHW